MKCGSLVSRHPSRVSQEELAEALDLSNAFIRTLEGKILYWSSGSEKTYGWKRSEALGRSSHELLRTRFSMPLQAINGVLVGQGSWYGRLLHRAKDDRILDVFSHWAVAQMTPRLAAPRVVEVNVVAAGARPDLATPVNSNDDPLITETLAGLVTSWNPAAQRVFGYAADEMIGRSVSPLFPPALADEQQRLIEKIRNGDQVGQYETTRVTKSGNLLTVLLTIYPVFDFEGRLVGISTMVRDITGRRRHEEALGRANESLEEFAYAAAHDLQEPLRNISLSLQQLVLTDSDLTPGQKIEMMDAAIRNSNRMQTLIKDLLAFSRAINSSHSKVSACDAQAVAAHATDNLQQAIEESRARLVIEGQLPSVGMHSSHLLQLLQNLIGNSIKYRNPDVPLVIKVAAVSEPAQVVFSVSDNGLGIAPQFHKRIFGVFKRLDNAMPGNGIGLAVCKRIVEHYAGTIWVESNLGGGAAFFFTVPALQKEPTPAALSASA